MVDAFRKQLDALMGANRNGDVEEVKKKYYEKDVCRPYLCGLCPHELFQLTKMDLGVCSRVHSLQLKKDYEEAKAKNIDDYERDLEDVLDKLVVECDRKIARALKRLEDDEGAAAGAVSVNQVTETPEARALTKKINVMLREAEELELQNKMEEKFKLTEEIEKLRQERADLQAQYLLDAFNKDRLAAPPPPVGGGAAPHPLGFPGTQIVSNAPDVKTQELINEKLKRAEELGEEGRVDEAQKLMEEADALKRSGARPDTLLPLLGSNVQIADQKLRVCDICGAFLSIFDSDRRLADHFGGKLHIGYMLIRERLEEIREARKLPKKPSEPRDVDPVEKKSDDDFIIINLMLIVTEPRIALGTGRERESGSEIGIGKESETGTTEVVIVTVIGTAREIATANVSTVVGTETVTASVTTEVASVTVTTMMTVLGLVRGRGIGSGGAISRVRFLDFPEYASGVHQEHEADWQMQWIGHLATFLAQQECKVRVFPYGSSNRTLELVSFNRSEY